MARLTLDQLSVIASAPLETTAVALARQLEQSYWTVYRAVERIRRAGGWYCRIEYRLCTECSEILVYGANHRKAHPACEQARAARWSRELIARKPGYHSPYVQAWVGRNPEVATTIQQRSRTRQRESWPALSPEYRRTKSRRAHAYQKAANDQTREFADQLGQPWTSDEDRYILDHPDWTARRLALDLGRTLHGVAGRRLKLRRRKAEGKAWRAAL